MIEHLRNDEAQPARPVSQVSQHTKADEQQSSGFWQKACVASPSEPQTKLQNEIAGGRVTTWTGRVVSLDAWRRLSEWERHGPNGRQWSGSTKSWETSK